MPKKKKITKSKMSKKRAQFFLRSVSDDTVFWVNDGMVFRNLDDFSNGLKSMDDHNFSHHLNKEKNDFYNWINNVIGDKQLSKSIKSVKSKTSLQKKIDTRLGQLRKA